MNSELLSKMDELISKINKNTEDGYIIEITKCLEEHFKNKRSPSASIGYFHKPIHHAPWNVKEINNTIPKEELEHFISFMRTSEDMKRRFNVIEYKSSIRDCENYGQGCEGMNCDCGLNERVIGYFVKLT